MRSEGTRMRTRNPKAPLQGLSGARLRLCCVLLLLPSIGCVQYTPHQLQPELNRKEFEQRSLHDPGLLQFLDASGLRRADPKAPWELNGLLLTAYYYSPSYQLLRAQWNTAQLRQATASQRPNPVLSLSPFYNTSNSAPSPWTLGAALEVPLGLTGRHEAIVARELFLLDAARFDLESLAWEERTKLRSATVQYSGARGQLTLLGTQEASQRELLKLKAAKHELGALGRAELNDASIQLGKLDSAVQSARLAQSESQSNLAHLLGIPLHALDGVQIASASLGEFPKGFKSKSTMDRALMQRTDVLAELARYGALEAALKLEVQKQYPNLILGPGYEFDQGDNKWNLGLSLQLPLFHGNQKAIDQAVAERREQEIQFYALQNQAINQIEQAFQAFQTARNLQELATKQTERLADGERLTSQMMELGESSREQLLSARIARLRSQGDAIQATTRLEAAIGLLEATFQDPLSIPNGQMPAWQADPRAAATDQAQ